MAECSQLLSLEKVTWLWIPPLCFSQRTPPPRTPTSSPALLLSEVIFCTIVELSPPTTSAPFYSQRPPARPGGESLILSPLCRFPHFSGVGCQHLFRAFTLASPALPTTFSLAHSHTLMHVRRNARPHTLWAVGSERTGLAYVTVITEYGRIILGPAPEASDKFASSDVY